MPVAESLALVLRTEARPCLRHRDTVMTGQILGFYLLMAENYCPVSDRVPRLYGQTVGPENHAVFRVPRPHGSGPNRHGRTFPFLRTHDRHSKIMKENSCRSLVSKERKLDSSWPKSIKIEKEKGT